MDKFYAGEETYNKNLRCKQTDSGPQAWEQLAVGDVAIAYGIAVNNVNI